VGPAGADAVLLMPARWTLGFVTASDNGYREGIRMAEEAFGHPRMGGRFGFAGPRARVSLVAR